MKTSELKSISNNLIGTFNEAGKISIDLFKFFDSIQSLSEYLLVKEIEKKKRKITFIFLI